MVKISDRVSKILPSGTLSDDTKARELKAREERLLVYRLVNLILIHLK